jgi:hypothetical protein
MRILVESDYHAGHILGLTPSRYWSESNPWARILWEERAKILAGIGKIDAHILNGDAIDGPGRKDSSAHLTTDIIEQTEMAIEAAECVKTKRRFVVKGTGYHTDAGGNLERVIASALNTEAVDELRLDIHGRKLHARHVVGRSDTPYGQMTQLQKEVVNDMLQAEMEDYESADIIVRSHVHYCTMTAVADAARGLMRHAVTTPALQLRAPVQSEYTRKLRTWLYHVGLTVIEIDKAGNVGIFPHIIPLKLTAPQSREYITL